MFEVADQNSDFRELWANFSSSGNQEDYYQGWIELQCARIPHVKAGVLVLRTEEQDTFTPIACWPAGKDIFQPLIELAERVIDEDCGLVSDLVWPDVDRPEGFQHYGVAYPLKIDQQITGVISIAVCVDKDKQLADAMENLQWGVCWVELMIRRHQATVLSSDLPKLKSAVEILASVLAEERYESASMTFVAEMASALECERVSLGTMHWGRIRIKAVSHSSQFGKRMNLIRQLEAAMEEAVFQRTEICYPETGQRHLVTRDHAQLAESHGCGAIYTLSLFGHGSYYGALTFERPADRQFVETDLEKIRSITALSSVALWEKRQNDRPVLIKAGDWLYVQLSRLLGAGYLGRKLALLLMLAIVIYFSIATGTYRVTADTHLEGAVRQVIIAPFDGYIDSSTVRAGDLVQRDQIIGRLDDRDLRLEHLNWVSDRAKLERQHEEAIANYDRGQVKVLAAQLEQNSANLKLVISQMERTVLRAPFDGLVLSGDLTQRLGGAVQQGEVLFEVAPLSAYRVILWVDEHQIADIEEGQTGHLILKALPEENLDFTVTMVTPITEARDGGNYFRVESLLQDSSDRLRPGMEGIGKVEIGERMLITNYMEPLIRWAKLKYWAMWP
jgi:multidrug resistance efflux pump